MIELSALNASAMSFLRLMTWGNVGVAAALVVGVTLWLACCAGGEERHPR